MTWFNKKNKAAEEHAAHLDRLQEELQLKSAFLHRLEARVMETLKGTAIPLDVQGKLHQVFNDAHSGKVKGE